MEINKAVDLLDNLIGMVEDNQENDYDGAFHMAIDALKAQADGNTISRQAVLNTVNATRKRCDTDSLDDYHALLTEAVENLPSAQPVDKGINVPCTDTISRQAACDAVCKAGCDSGFCGVECPEVMALRNLQPAQPEILQDGTLMIDVPDLDTVNRVIVSSGKMCKVFYMDDSERRTDDLQ